MSGLMTKLIAVLLSAAIVVLCLGGCSDKTAGQLFKYDLDADPANLDPQLANDYASLLVIENTMEGLLRLKEDGGLTEGVATDYTVSDDGTTYKFTLRQNAKWQNGDPVTAHDFVFAFQRLFKPETGSTTAQDFYCIKNSQSIHKGEMDAGKLGVSAKDDYTLIIQLDYPNAMFPALLTTAAAMPCNKDFFYDTKGKYGLEAKTTLSNGPFYLKAWGHDDYLSCRLNDQYQSAQQPVASGVSFIVEDSREDQISRFQKQQSSAIVLSGQEAAELREKNYQFTSFENTVWGIAFNQNGTPFANKNLRLALLYAFSPQSFDKQLPEDLKRISAVVPQSITLLNRAYRDYAGSNMLPEFNAAKAREYLALAKNELGADKLNGLELIAPAGTGVDHLGLFSYVSQIWQKELGIYLAVKELPADEFQTALESGNYQCAITSLSAQYNSPASVLSSFTSGSAKNLFGYKSETYDSILAGAARQNGLSQAAAEYKKAERRIINDGVFLPLYVQKEYFTTEADTTGVIYHAATKMVQFSQGRKKG